MYKVMLYFGHGSYRSFKVDSRRAFNDDFADGKVDFVDAESGMRVVAKPTSWYIEQENVEG